MNPKILLLALPIVIFSNCSTAYKSGQTPDDVYYSPVKFIDEKQNNDRKEVKEESEKDYDISMSIRDRRWRDFDNDYDYNNSPYYYCNCKCNNYGYYYNPSYHPWPVYIARIIPLNTTPRMVNLNAYRGYHNNAAGRTKTGNGITWVTPTASYNNSNEKNTRKTITPTNNSSSNNTRTYTPSTNNSSSNSSGSNSSGTVTRPKRGG